MQPKVHHWKRKYMENVAVNKRVVPGQGVHLVQCASIAVEELMHSEDQYMHFSGQCSKKAQKEYWNAVVLSIWTNKSTFYENLHPILIAHVKHHWHETVFHPAKILMQMDLAGGQAGHYQWRGSKSSVCVRLMVRDMLGTQLFVPQQILSIVVERLINWLKVLCHMSMGILMTQTVEVNLFSGIQCT